VSAPDKKYCGDCGALLSDDDKSIRSQIEAQLQAALDTRFKDQKLVEYETTLAITARITDWAKTFAFWAGVPVALFLIVLAILGVQKFGDFTSKIDQAIAKITPALDASIKQADDAQAKSAAAQNTAEAAQTEASDALASVDTIVEQTKIQLTTDMNSKIQSISPRLEAFEQTATQIEKSSADVLKQVGDVKKQLDVASDTIASQEKKLTDTSEMVKALFSRGNVEFFEPTLTPNNMVIIKHDETHASVYLLLKEVPIPVTLQLQYHVYLQPRQAYGVLSAGDRLTNVVAFRWGENADNLKDKGLTASYIGDPTANSAVVKILTVKGNHAYADDNRLPYVFSQYESKQ
jgi:F0F1-type ATP synthase membrane subunit b/b'